MLLLPKSSKAFNSDFSAENAYQVKTNPVQSNVNSTYFSLEMRLSKFSANERECMICFGRCLTLHPAFDVFTLSLESSRCNQDCTACKPMFSIQHALLCHIKETHNILCRQELWQRKKHQGIRITIWCKIFS